MGIEEKTIKQSIGEYLNIPEDNFLLTWKDCIYYERKCNRRSVSTLIDTKNKITLHNLRATVTYQKSEMVNGDTIWRPRFPLSTLFPMIPDHVKVLQEQIDYIKDSFPQHNENMPFGIATSYNILEIYYKKELLYTEQLTSMSEHERDICVAGNLVFNRMNETIVTKRWHFSSAPLNRFVFTQKTT